MKIQITTGTNIKVLQIVLKKIGSDAKLVSNPELEEFGYYTLHFDCKPEHFKSSFLSTMRTLADYRIWVNVINISIEENYTQYYKLDDYRGWITELHTDVRPYNNYLDSNKYGDYLVNQVAGSQ